MLGGRWSTYHIVGHFGSDAFCLNDVFANNQPLDAFAPSGERGGGPPRLEGVLGVLPSLVLERMRRRTSNGPLRVERCARSLVDWMRRRTSSETLEAGLPDGGWSVAEFCVADAALAHCRVHCEGKS